MPRDTNDTQLMHFLLFSRRLRQSGVNTQGFVRPIGCNIERLDLVTLVLLLIVFWKVASGVGCGLDSGRRAFVDGRLSMVQQWPDMYSEHVV